MKEENIGKPPSANFGKKVQNADLKNLLRDFSLENFTVFSEAFAHLDDRQKCETYVKVLKYVLPVISAVRFEDAGAADTASGLLRAVSSYPDDKM